MATFVLLLFYLVTNVIAVTSIYEPPRSTLETNSDMTQKHQIADSVYNLSIPYVDQHYGYADGIVDPLEYGSNYTDPTSGVSVYLEHNGSLLFIGLTAERSSELKPEAITIAWKNYTDDFSSDGLNNSDLITGYAPGTPHTTVWRARGTDIPVVHYLLKLRNGTLLQEGDVPGPDGTSTLDEIVDYPDFEDPQVLLAYGLQIYGMRIGETRHFIIPAEDAYNTPGHELYGLDLEYEITLTQLNREGQERTENPADYSQIVYSDRYGISTLNNLPDANQSRIIAANGSDDGNVVQLEYFIQMNSTDPKDIPLLNMTDIYYPFVLMFSDSEELFTIPVLHSDWSNPLLAELTPNSPPTLIAVSPLQDDILQWVVDLSLNVTDTGLVRHASYRITDRITPDTNWTKITEPWTELAYNFKTKLWEDSADLTKYSNGDYTTWFNATDSSNETNVHLVNFTISRPFVPLRGMRLSVERTVTTLLYHGISIEDEYQIVNNGSVPIGAIELYLPGKWASKFISITAEDDDENSLEVARLENIGNMLHWRVYFFEPIPLQETYTVSTMMHFHSLHTLINEQDELYEVVFPTHPVIPYVLTSSQLILAFRSGDTLEGDTPEKTEYNLEPFTIEESMFTMKSFTPDIVAERTTEITVDSWGWLSYHETFHLKNIGPTKEGSLTFTLPLYSTGITIYDNVGILAQTQVSFKDQLWNETTEVRLHLKQDRFGDDEFMPDYEYTFNVDYVVQATSHQKPDPLGTRLQVPFSGLGEILVLSHTVDIVIPLSTNLVELSGDYRVLYGIFDTTRRFVFYNSTSSSKPDISLVYQAAIGAVARPVVFSLLIGIVGAVYVVYRKAQLLEEAVGVDFREVPSDELTPVGAPPELLKKFAALYSQKTALNIDLEKLKASRRRGKITKKAFMIRQTDLKRQIDNIDDQLPKVKDELMSYGTKYRDLISQLELQNEKIEGAKAGLRQLLLRKKKQRISRAAFEKSRQDYLKTIQKATSATDRILLTIEEEAGEL
jgi:hypothetical protein